MSRLALATRSSAAAPDPAAPRLLTTAQAAHFLNVSAWTVRSWVADGLLSPVELPPLRPRPGDRRQQRLRRLLFDRADLDAFVDGLRRSP